MAGLGLQSLIPEKDKKNLAEEQIKEEKDKKVDDLKETKDYQFYYQKNKNSFYYKNKDFEQKKKNFEAVFQIEIDKIKSNPYQPRKEFKPDDLKELAESIRTYGILQPLIVTKIEKENESGTIVEYQLIAGERRLMAAKLIGLERVPVIIKNINHNNHQLKLEMALIENLQRSDLNPIEEARAYARLNEEFGLTQQEIALRVGKSREAIANSMRLLKLPFEIQQALIEGKINESQARMLLSIENYEEQRKIFKSILEEKLSVRNLKEKILNKERIIDPQINYLQKQLEEEFNTPVKISKLGKKGKIIIHFFSEEELENLIKKLLSSKEEY